MRTHTSSALARSALFASLLATTALAGAAPASADAYLQTNLVTDNQATLIGLGFAPAANVDPQLINPWGISHSPAGSPFWVSDAGTGKSTIYNSLGTPIPAVTTTTPPFGPTGQIDNTTSDFKVGGAASNFIFATLGGTIDARTTGNNAPIQATVPGAVFTGLAIGNNGSGNFLYATDFKNGKVDVFDGSFALQSSGFSFVDPHLADPGFPPGLSPFNVQALNGHLFVTYAIPDPVTHQKVGAGLGVVAEFDLSGNFIRDVAVGGLLNAPWGLDIAPSGFGAFSGDLLVGNFGDGTINVYDPNGTNALLGTLMDSTGKAISMPGLWAIINGTGLGGLNGGNASTVYFAAGIGDEAHGLFGSISLMPEPASLALLAAGLAGLGGMATRRRRTAAVS